MNHLWISHKTFFSNADCWCKFLRWNFVPRTVEFFLKQTGWNCEKAHKKHKNFHRKRAKNIPLLVFIRTLIFSPTHFVLTTRLTSMDPTMSSHTQKNKISFISQNNFWMIVDNRRKILLRCKTNVVVGCGMKYFHHWLVRSRNLSKLYQMLALY